MDYSYIGKFMKKFKLDKALHNLGNTYDIVALALDKMYENGFADGVNEAQRENKPLSKKEQHKLSVLWDKIPDDLVEDIGLLVDLEKRNQ